jgi:hypothetical protein
MSKPKKLPPGRKYRRVVHHHYKTVVNKKPNPATDAIAAALVRTGVQLLDAFVPGVGVAKIYDEAIAAATTPKAAAKVDGPKVINLKQTPEGVYE